MYEMFHDDITWCMSDCSNTACERHPSNRLSQTGLFSAALLKDTIMCPLYNQKGNLNSNVQGDVMETWQLTGSNPVSSDGM